VGIKPCYIPGGGWWGDFQELYVCHSLPPISGCDGSQPGPFGPANFIWTLKPIYAQK
jgi:hypothetical protein